MPSIAITDQQARLYQQCAAAMNQARRELALVIAAILGAHEITEASDVQLVQGPGAPALLIYQIPPVAVSAPQIISSASVDPLAPSS